MSTVTFTRGIPGSGKSTAARKLTRETAAVRTCLDDLRAMVGDYNAFSKERERLVLSIQDDIILTAVRAGRDVVIDETCLHDKTPRRVATLLWEENLPVEFAILDFTGVDVDVCVVRDVARRNRPDERSVGPDVMTRMVQTLQREQRKGLWTVESIKAGLPEIVPVESDPSLPPAIIVDVDGTLARADHRGPYDFDRLDTDELHAHIGLLVEAVGAYHLDPLCPESQPKVIICSGRHAEYRETTLDWLMKHGIMSGMLLMRPPGDKRRDSIIKLELFNEHIRGKYNVLFALDDRDRVVKVWRALGVPCLQVAEGRF